MKIRSGFVSNSSSSSFVCCICGRSEGGYDMSLEDAGMVETKRYNSTRYKIFINCEIFICM